jgi:hypothetical protein
MTAVFTHHRYHTRWHTMATIEVARECGPLDDVLADISFDSHLKPAASPSPDTLRFDLVVNAARGEDRAAMATFALLSALEAIAENGGLPGFRIVSGEHWLRDPQRTLAESERRGRACVAHARAMESAS